MNEVNYAAADSPARVRRTPEKTARRLAWIEWNRQFSEEARRLNETEPLPDNFEDLCQGAGRGSPGSIT